jgi:16S rRNA (cytidine1402-2'-O)-methyltransferase
MNMEIKKKGCLYLIPMPLGQGGEGSLTAIVKEVLGRIDFYIVERERTFRRFLNAILDHPLQERLELVEFGEGDRALLDRVTSMGIDVGLVSEAGCPGVADPGSDIVKYAHSVGIRVVPLSGPSSIILSLMASGFNGQEFHFHGYLPRDKEGLSGKLRRLEEEVLKTGVTQLFIETPYRNVSLMRTMLEILKKESVIVVAVDLTLPEQDIRRATVGKWSGQDLGFLDKRPVIFLLGN